MSDYTKTVGLPAVLALQTQGPATHTIRLHGDGHVLPGMELLESYDGERQKNGTLVAQGGVEFRTPRGKKLFLKYSEFSFLFREEKLAA